MIHSDVEARRLAFWLTALAGYVDAVGFLMLGGFFVSFMSGNTTRMSSGIIHHAADWQLAGFLIFSFFLGVIAGSLTGRIARRRHRAVLMLVAVGLCIAALCSSIGLVLVAAAMMAFAMGGMNATFERDGEVQIGLTYMTGTIVKAGQRIAGALMGEDPAAWRPHALLWISLSFGAVAGASTFRWLHGWALWLALIAVLPAIWAASRLDEA